MSRNFYQNLGILRRANLLLMGTKLHEAIAQRKVFLVVIAMDASQKSKKTILNKCKYYDCPIIFYGERQTLSKAIGKNDIVAIGILDQSFASKIYEQLKEVVS
ncbi:MAG: hypothetical protein GX845_03855 [Erysipelothrix sp.]|jgi:ribosomal protein L7Ae-like RNA K-turn-binding protein|nr:hypothetical protein [Erysipelothrix sp.]